MAVSLTDVTQTLDNAFKLASQMRLRSESEAKKGNARRVLTRKGCMSLERVTSVINDIYGG